MSFRHGITVTEPGVDEGGAAPAILLRHISLPPLVLKEGVAVNVLLQGSTLGSRTTIASGTLPEGLTLDLQSLTLSGTPAASGTASIILRETLEGALNSPRDSLVVFDVAAADPEAIPPLSSLTYTPALAEILDDAAPGTQLGTLSGLTPGATLSLTGADVGAGRVVLGTGGAVLTGLADLAGLQSLAFSATQTLAGAPNSPLTAGPWTVTVSPAESEPEEPAPYTVSIEDNGWVLAVTGSWDASAFGDFALDPDGLDAGPGVTVTTIGQGYKRSGGIVVADDAATRTLVATKPLRLPWRTGEPTGSEFVGTLGETDNGNGTRTVRLALSEWVHAGETVNVAFRAGWRFGEAAGTLAAIPNQSTRAYFKPIVQWIQPSFAPPEQYRHPSDPNKQWVEVPVAAPYPKGKEAVAGVRFVAYDGTHTPKELWVTAQVTSPLFGDNLRVWGGYIDLTDLDPGFVTVHWEVCPWVGDVRKSGTAHVASSGDDYLLDAEKPLHLVHDPDRTLFPEKFVAIDPVNGTATSGNVTVGDTWAAAKGGTCALDYSTAVRALRLGLAYTRPANNGFNAATNSVEYMRVGFLAGIHTGSGTSTSASSIGANTGRLIFMGDPDEADPTADIVVRADPLSDPQRLYLKRAWIENLKIEAGGKRVFSFIEAGSQVHVDNVVVRSLAGMEANNGLAIYVDGTGQTATRYDYDHALYLRGGGVDAIFYRNSRSTKEFRAVAHISCERIYQPGENYGAFTGYNVADQMIWGCKGYKIAGSLGATNFASGSGTAVDPYQLERLAVVNTLLESVSGDRFIAVGESAYSELVECIFDGVVMVGNGFNIHVSSNMVPLVNLRHRGNIFRNFAMGRWSTKQDIFSGDGSLTGSWELLYGVGYNAVIHGNTMTGGAWAQHHREFPGLNSIDRMGDGVAATGVAFLDVVDYAADQGTSLGNGDYHPNVGSPLVGVGTRATTDEYLDHTLRGVVFNAGVLPMVGGDTPAGSPPEIDEIDIPAALATYYVDYEGGSDSNAGTSEASPWQHAPGDADATHGHTPTPGDKFILRGGVRYQGQIGMRASGTPEAPILYEGGEWGEKRAILDASRPVATLRPATSQEDAGGALNWRALHVIEDLAILKSEQAWFMDEAAGLLFAGRYPAVERPFFSDDTLYSDSEFVSHGEDGADLNTLESGYLTSATLAARLAGQEDTAWLALWVQPNVYAYRRGLTLAGDEIHFSPPPQAGIYQDAGHAYLTNDRHAVTSPGFFAVIADGKAIVQLREGYGSLRRLTGHTLFSYNSQNHCGLSHVTLMGLNAHSTAGVNEANPPAAICNRAYPSGSTTSGAATTGNFAQWIRVQDCVGPVDARRTWAIVPRSCDDFRILHVSGERLLHFGLLEYGWTQGFRGRYFAAQTISETALRSGGADVDSLLSDAIVSHMRGIHANCYTHYTTAGTPANGTRLRRCAAFEANRPFAAQGTGGASPTYRYNLTYEKCVGLELYESAYHAARPGTAMTAMRLDGYMQGVRLKDSHMMCEKSAIGLNSSPGRSDWAIENVTHGNGALTGLDVWDLQTGVTRIADPAAVAMWINAQIFEPLHVRTAGENGPADIIDVDLRGEVPLEELVGV